MTDDVTSVRGKGGPRSLNTVAALTFLGLAASVPFLLPFHTLPLPSFQSEWCAAFLGVAAMLAWLCRHSPLEVAVPRIAIAPAALCSVIALQWALGMFAYASTAVMTAMYLFWATSMAVAGRSLAAACGERLPAVTLAWFILASGLAGAACGFAQYWGWWPLAEGWIVEPMPISVHGVYGNLAQQNHFATHLALALGAVLYLRAVAVIGWRSAAACVAVLFVALMLSGARSSLIYVAWLLTLFAWLARHRNGRPVTARTLHWVLAAFAALIAGLWFGVHVFSATPQLARIASMSGAFGPRIYLWKHAVQMFLDKPLLGVGFDSFAFHLVEQLHGENGPTTWGIDQYAHNLVLQLLAVAGFCGFAAVAYPCFFFFRRQFALIHSITEERIWFWSVLGMLAIHSMLEQPLFYAYFLGLAALFVGMADRAEWKTQWRSKGKWAAAFALLLAMAMLAGIARDYGRLEKNFYGGRYGQINGAGPTYGQRAMLIDMNSHSLFAPLTELIAPGLFVPANAPIGQRLALNRRIMHYAPTAEVEFRQAALLAEAGDLAEAEQQFKRAAYAYPSEAAEYLVRFDALATVNPQGYGALASFSHLVVAGFLSMNR